MRALRGEDRAVTTYNSPLTKRQRTALAKSIAEGIVKTTREYLLGDLTAAWEDPCGRIFRDWHGEDVIAECGEAMRSIEQWARKRGAKT